MGIATRLGPWLLGTVKDTTGTTASTIRNVGAVPVQQTKVINFSDTSGSTAFALPAGSMISAMQLYTTTPWAGTTPTVRFLINGVQYVGNTNLPSSTGVTTLSPLSTQVATSLNIGTADALVTYEYPSVPTAGVGTIVIAYIVRNPDGTIT
jgi:hypothetical protein